MLDCAECWVGLICSVRFWYSGSSHAPYGRCDGRCCFVLCCAALCMCYVGSWVSLCCVVLCYIVELGLGLELVSSLVQELFAVIAQPRPQP